MTGKTMTRPLTDAERTLVERYHNLIYRVMHDLHLGTEADTDLYGEAALGLILAAQRYLTDESLQKYRFTTIAYSRIRNALLRQRRRERRQPQVLSLDAWQADGGTLYDVLPDERCADPADIVIRRERAALQKGRAVRSCRVYRFPACAAPGRRRHEMGVHTGVYVVYYLYRSRYSFVADHCLKDGHHIVDFSNLEKALKFPSESQARRFIADDLERPESGPYFVSELSLGELLEYCPDMYEVRRAARNGGAA